LTPKALWRSVDNNHESNSPRRPQPSKRLRCYRNDLGVTGRPILRTHLRLFEQLSERRSNNRFRRELPPQPNLSELEFPNRVIRETVQSSRATRDRKHPARIFAIAGNVGHSHSSIRHRTTKPRQFSPWQ
jgi:hypothetical protein